MKKNKEPSVESPTLENVLIHLGVLLAMIVLTRVLFLIHKNTSGCSRFIRKKRTAPCKTVICIGSGGHTTEMLRLISGIDFKKYSPRYYIMASSDRTSYSKVKELEIAKSCQITCQVGEYHIIQIPRSRRVHQSYITSIFTTIYSILYSIPLMLRLRPDLILCNGPGTCIPICGLAFLMKICFIKYSKIVFIESFCRTRTFSLTGKILIYFADNFLVQWPSLKAKCKRAEYIGQLM